MNISEIFKDIYEKNKWEMGQSESKSGLGSTIKFTENMTFLFSVVFIVKQ